MDTISTALISVSDKTNIIEFAKNLNKLGIKILSTGGTAETLKRSGLKVTEVSEHTGFPEILDGRVKTLHPKIHGGILAKRDDDNHLNTAKEHKIDLIDLVVINLYPFQETIAKKDCTYELAIENIDIGGPAMIRSAAKNHASVAIVTDPRDYDLILKELNENNGTISKKIKEELAKKAFGHTASYDKAIYAYLNQINKKEKDCTYPDHLNIELTKVMDMRYGENPHQTAAFYKENSLYKGALSNFSQLQGKELSFNNLNDAENAWECVKNLTEKSCVIVKHANPCGAASANNALTAYLAAFKTDPTSAFGGIIAFNTIVDEDTATEINKQFAELIIANFLKKNQLKIIRNTLN
jgi:phosphoribosylaminoimidazolecarboxamide formyltransferase/IMP cyclohydrolase